MKQLTWKLVLPLTIISFVTFTKWWYVLPVDAPDSMMIGFPFPFICEGWHTSMSLQIFIIELCFDLLIYFLFWFIVISLIDRFLIKIKPHKILTIALLTLSGLITIMCCLVVSNKDNIFFMKRPFKVEIITTGFKTIWVYQDRPTIDEYDNIKMERE